MTTKNVFLPEVNPINKNIEQKITSDKNVISKLAYIVNIFYAIGSTVFETLYQYLAIFLGSAGLIQGFITSIRQLGNALLNPVWGRLSDKFGRRRFLLIGNFFLGLNSLLIPNSPSIFFLFIFIIFQTILNAMIIPTWSGYLGDITAKSVARRAAIIGRLGMVTTLLSNLLLVFLLFFVDIIDPQRISMHVLIIPFYFGAITYFIATFFAYRLPTLKNKPQKKLSQKSSLEIYLFLFHMLDY